MKNILITLLYLAGVTFFCLIAAEFAFGAPNEVTFEIHSVEYIGAGSSPNAWGLDRATIITTVTGAKYVFTGWIDTPAKGTLCMIVYNRGVKSLKIL
jgi:hypothetical protein